MNGSATMSSIAFFVSSFMNAEARTPRRRTQTKARSILFVLILTKSVVESSPAERSVFIFNKRRDLQITSHLLLSVLLLSAFYIPKTIHTQSWRIEL